MPTPRPETSETSVVVENLVKIVIGTFQAQ
jgi:hypothetical protein